MIAKENIEKHCQDLYKRTYDLWISLKDSYPDWKYGYNILYAPPQIKPKIFILSFQGAGGDKTVRKTWPKVNFYSESKYPLGQKLSKIFTDVGRYQLLRNGSGSSVIFFQSPNMNQWKSNPTIIREKLEEFSLKEVKDLLYLMKPRVILAIGLEVFKRLEVQEAESPIKGRWCDIVKKGEFGNSKLIAVPHLTGARLSREDLSTIMKHIIEAVGGEKRKCKLRKRQKGK